MTKKFKIIFMLSLSVFLLYSMVLSQSQETGALEGKITDESGELLPGVTVTIKSPRLMGSHSSISDMNGKYRFVLLPAGTYSVEASLEGFGPQKNMDVRVNIGTTFVIDFVLKQATIREEVLVRGEAPIIDIRDSSAGKTIISKEMLLALPSARTLNEVFMLAPGVESDTYFGGSEKFGNAFNLDGVDFTEAKWGSSWIDFNYNALEEVQISGRGAPAEYGGFTGALVNAVSKSGGNKFEGMVEFLFQSENWNSDNFNPDDPNYAYVGAAPTSQYMEVAANLGGRIIKDKLWFFTAFTFQKTDLAVAGYDLKKVTTYPLGFLKLSFQPNPRLRFQAFAEIGRNRSTRQLLSAMFLPEATVNQNLKKFVWAVSSQNIFSDNTFMEVKVAGFNAPQNNDPVNGPDVACVFDLSVMKVYNNYAYISSHKLKRFQTQASLSHYQENLAGSHDFKLGVSYSRFSGQSTNHTTGDMFYRINMPGLPPGGGVGMVVGDNWFPIAHQYGMYIQDSWKISDNLTINPGLRFEIYRGYLKNRDFMAYKTSSLSPRIGFTWNVFGDYKTALKVHFGRYSGQLILDYFSCMDTGSEDKVTYLVLPGEEPVELSRLRLSEQIEEIYSIDPNIKHPALKEFVVGIDREIIPNLSFGVNFMHRKWVNFVEQVNIGGDWEPIQFLAPDGNSYTVYNQLNPGEDKYYITNPEPGKDIGQAYPGIVGIPLWRKYTGVEARIVKRLSNNWELLISYVYSSARGTIENRAGESRGTAGVFEDPNEQILAEGHLDIDPTHLFKVQGTVVLPLGFNLGGYFSIISGRTYADILNVGRLNQGTVNILVTESGSKSNPTRINLDLRLEKTLFFSGTAKLGLMFDVFNLFNAGTATGTNSDIGSTRYGMPTAIVMPRSVRLGARVMF